MQKQYSNESVRKCYSSSTLFLLFCRLLINFANSLDPDQARQKVGPDLDPNGLTLMVFLKELLKKGVFGKNQQTTMYAKC